MLSGYFIIIKSLNVYAQEVVKTWFIEILKIISSAFQNVTSFQPKDFHIHSAMQEVNKEKNRSLDIIPGNYSYTWWLVDQVWLSV